MIGKIISALNKMKKYLTNFSVLLIFISYVSIIIYNNPNDIKILLPLPFISILFIFAVIQLAANYFLLRFDNRIIKFAYLFILFTLFTVFNLTNFLVSASEQINKHFFLYLRIRDVLSVVLIVFALISFYLRSRFVNALKMLNLFLVLFSLLNIIHALFHLSNKELKNIYAVEQSYKPKSEIQSQEDTLTKRNNIICILLDEYSSPLEIINFTKDSLQALRLSKYLESLNFSVVNTKTIHNSTINSINILFNQNSGLTFNDESTEKAREELKNSFVIKHLEDNNYVFKNFSLYEIGNHKPFFKWDDPYVKGAYENILRFSLLPLIFNSLKEDSTSNAMYNKLVEQESLQYINSLKGNVGNFIYVHFLIPHGPFYIENEFSYKSRNLKNYILYWNFCNEKVIKYLGSIDKLNHYNVIITSDHGFRSDRKVNPFNTFSAFYNFDKNEVEKIKTVQEIGILLLKQ